jgi:hypothetical protein
MARCTWVRTVEERVARCHVADAVQEFVRGDVLAEEAAGSGAQGPGHVLVGLERREDEDAGGGEVGVGADGGGGGEPVGPRHSDVHEDDVGAVGMRE